MQIETLNHLYKENPYLQYFEKNRNIVRKIITHQTLVSIDTKHEIFFAYLAGLIDGEGSITIFFQKNNNHYGIHLSISQANFPFLKKLYDEIGSRGKIASNINWKYNTEGYTIQYSGIIAASLLKRCLPYMRRKHKQAILAIYIHELLSSIRKNEVRISRNSFAIFYLKYCRARAKYLNVIPYHPVKNK